MAKTSKAQREVIGRVMEEFKRGDLSIGRNGPAVTNPKQATAVALREAGASNRQPPAKNRAALRRYRGKAAADGSAGGGPTKATLYAEARRRGIAGRSAMSKGELEAALR